MPNNLTRPTLISTPAFDATQSHTFTFTVYGQGQQVVANRLVIRNQTTNETVYDEKQETFRYEHIVSANKLTNNTYYNAVITTFDANDNESTESVPIQFWCYSSPVLTITNMPATNIVENASYTFQFTYTQAENEPLNSYVVNLYSAAQTLISTSNTVYVTDGTPPYSGSYLFTGLSNSTEYYIEIVGSTINNTTVTTGLQQFSVRYAHPDVFALVELVNNCKGGYISVTSNIVLIEGTSNPDPPTYIDNKEVDLREDGSWVEWNSGYTISGDFLSRSWFRDPNVNTELIRFSNAQGQTISVIYREGYEDVDATDLQGYMEVYVNSMNEDFSYYIFSNFVDIPDPEDATKSYSFWLRRVNNIYQAQLGTT